MPRKSIGETAMTDAERQAARPITVAGRGAGPITSPDSWKLRWSSRHGWTACRRTYRTPQLPKRCEQSVNLTSANFRRSFHPAALAGTDHPPLTLTHVMHRNLPRPPLRATPKALRYGRGSLLCMTWISSGPGSRRGQDWTRKRGRNWERFDTPNLHEQLIDQECVRIGEMVRDRLPVPIEIRLAH